MHTFPTLLCQDQSTVAQRAEMTVTECSLTSYLWACFLIGFHTMPWQQHSQLTLTWLGQGCMHVRWNLPPALLAKWLESLHAAAVTRGVEQTPNKSQHTKLTLEKKILPLLLLGFKLATLWSWIQRSYQQAIQAPNRGITVPLYSTHRQQVCEVTVPHMSAAFTLHPENIHYHYL